MSERTDEEARLTRFENNVLAALRIGAIGAYVAGGAFAVASAVAADTLGAWWPRLLIGAALLALGGVWQIGASLVRLRGILRGR